MNKCTRQKKFLFWKWDVEEHTFIKSPLRKKDCTFKQICSICGKKDEIITLHNFSYNSPRQVGTIRKCERCGIEQILYKLDVFDGGVVGEHWKNHVKL